MNGIRDPFSPSRIVCAALLFPDGLLLVGARHWDNVMRCTAQAIKRYDESESGLQLVGREQSGFIDQHGKFFTRQEAWKIAEANNQIRRRVGGDEANGGTLYSENLY